MKLSYRTTIFKILRYRENDLEQIYKLTFYPLDDISFSNTIVFVDEDTYKSNTSIAIHSNDQPRWVAFKQKKL